MGKIKEDFVRGFKSWITPRDEYLLKFLFNKNSPKSYLLTTDHIEILVYSKNICQRCWKLSYHMDTCSCGSTDIWRNKPSSWRNTTNKSLKQLYENYCIDRFEPPVGRNEGSAPQHVILDRAGAIWIAKKLEVERLRWRKTNYIPQTYKHDLLILDFYCALELDRLKNPYGEIIYWQQDPHTKRSFTYEGIRYSFRPDIFVIYKHANNRIKMFFVEIDNGTESTERLKNKIKTYKNYYLSGNWREEHWARLFPNTFPLTMFVTTVRNDLRALQDHCRENNVQIIFKTFSELVDYNYKEYINKLGKIRKVLQSVNSRIIN